MSVRPHGKTRLPLDGFSLNLIFEYFCENMSRKVKFPLSRTRIQDTLHEDQYILFIISHSFRLRMRNSSDKVVEKIKTHILCSVNFFENRAVYEKMRKKYFKGGRPQVTIWRHSHCMLDT